MNLPKRYAPALVALHWIIFLLVFTEAALGIYVDNFVAPESKASLLGIHMIIGMVTLAVMIVRIFVRSKTPKPAHLTAGNAFFDFIGKLTHYGLYVFVILTTSTGMIAATQGQLFQIIYGGVGQLPEDFMNISTFIFHMISLPLLILTIFLHIGAAFYHQLFLKDNLMDRMRFGK